MRSPLSPANCGAEVEADQHDGSDRCDGTRGATVR